jgi:hypothetical protein
MNILAIQDLLLLLAPSLNNEITAEGSLLVFGDISGDKIL